MNILKLLNNTPFHPYWLEIRNCDKKNNQLLMKLHGKVLETGAGNCVIKERAISINKKIDKYVATDYSSWDDAFLKQKKSISKYNQIIAAIYTTPKDESKIDVICDAMNLPFSKNSFDCYCSFEVLEHIENPDLFFKEAHRVLKKGGLCITVTPFLYPQHGGEDHDFQRISIGGFRSLAKRNGFNILDSSTASFFGTSITSLINQYTIRKIVESRLLPRLLILLFAPFVFLITNILGFIIDTVDQDKRFALRYHILMQKQ